MLLEGLQALLRSQVVRDPGGEIRLKESAEDMSSESLSSRRSPRHTSDTMEHSLLLR